MNKRPVPQNRSPKVSIILPAFNRGEFISDAIDSIQAMSFKDWELIIVDDGSKDQTHKIVDKYLADERIHYLNKETNQGPGVSRNIGLQESKGEYIAYLDSDNTYNPDFISLAIEFLEKNKSFDLVYGSLLTESHGEENKPILFKEFSREMLLKGNYIDLNTVIHRRKLYALLGGFDETLTRMADWDLILKYTQKVDAKGLPIVAANYRVLDGLRVTQTNLAHPNAFKILSKWPPNNNKVSKLRILYIVSRYPQLSETYIDCEIKKMQQWGYEIEVWRHEIPKVAYNSDLHIHDGDLRGVINKLKPDLIHIHWLSEAQKVLPLINDLNIPITIKAHSFDTTEQALKFCVQRSSVKKIYGFPVHADLLNHPKLTLQNVVFDTSLFKPSKNKNRHLIVRAGAALPSKSLPFFIHLAKELPEFKFVLAVIRCHDDDDYINELKKLADDLHSPVEIRTNLSHEATAELISEAAIYLHTADTKITTIGQPISIAEAMATGCYIVASNYESMNNYIAESGKTYNDMTEAKKIIKDTELWSDDRWDKAWKNSIERAFSMHADEIILRPMFLDWTKIYNERLIATKTPEAKPDKFNADLANEIIKLNEEIVRRGEWGLKLDKEIVAVKIRLNQIITSRSFRWTKPLRFIARLARKWSIYR